MSPETGVWPRPASCVGLLRQIVSSRQRGERKTLILGEWKPADVPSKTFSRNKMPYEVRLVLSKTFSRNQIAGFGGEYYLHIGQHTISRRKSAAW